MGAGVDGTEAGGCEEVDPGWVAEPVAALDAEVVGAVELDEELVGDEAKALDASPGPPAQPHAMNADEIRQA